jgi:nicotinamidase/pyrazinamidase
LERKAEGAFLSHLPKSRLDQSALIVVDVQNDFCPGGALPVKNGDKVIPILNEYIGEFSRQSKPIFFTRDWHPKNHISFVQRGGRWPPHCLKNSKGARFHPSLIIPNDAILVSKGTEKDKEAYSGFEGTALAETLRSMGIQRIFIGGLATDYCVKSTVLDGLKSGFETYVLKDASMGINASPGDSKKALSAMQVAGARIYSYGELFK